jgi:hypothetical protein
MREYDVVLGLQDSETGQRQGKPVSIQPVTVQSEICNLAMMSDAKAVNAIFGDKMRLQA